MFLDSVKNCPTFKCSNNFQSAKLARYHPYNMSTKRWVGGDGQMLMFADMVGGWVGGRGQKNTDVDKKNNLRNFIFQASERVGYKEGPKNADVIQGVPV